MRSDGGCGVPKAAIPTRSGQVETSRAVHTCRWHLHIFPLFPGTCLLQAPRHLPTCPSPPAPPSPQQGPPQAPPPGDVMCTSFSLSGVEHYVVIGGYWDPAGAGPAGAFRFACAREGEGQAESGKVKKARRHRTILSLTGLWNARSGGP